MTIERPATDVQRDVELLGSLPLFATLSVASRRRLISAASERRYAAGATLFRATEPSAGLFVILAGQVRVVRGRDGRQLVIHTEGPGGTLGEVPLFGGGTMPATAEALTAVRCLHVNEDELVALIHIDPSIAVLFLRRLAVRLRGLVERLERDATLPILSRLSAFLLERSRSARSETFSLGMTQEALAEELGTVREVVVRGLAHLRHDVVIVAAGRGRFIIRDVEALHRLARD